MADVDLTPTKVGIAGVASPAGTALAIADTYFVKNRPKTVLHFVKTGAGAATITFVTPGTAPGGLAIADPTVNVPATTGDVFVALGKYPSVFNDSNGEVSFTTDEDTAITCAVLELD